jgi:hypothetical protein
MLPMPSFCSGFITNSLGLCVISKNSNVFNSFWASYVDRYTRPQEITESSHNSNGSMCTVVQHTSLSKHVTL